METSIQECFDTLRKYCEEREFRGWDPYDGLNSKLFRKTPLYYSRLARIIWIQFFKRSPINLRRIVGVGKEANPQGLALFLSGYCNLAHIGDQNAPNSINSLVKRLIGMQTEGYNGACWGYNFEWQARAFRQPKFSPTVVATTFATNALLDAYDITKEEKLLAIARSSCDFVLKDLNRINDDAGDFCFTYSPLDKTVVFNASLLASHLLARVYSYTNEVELKERASQSVRFCCRLQGENGSWTYGTKPYHQWIDNFHTGYNLECIGKYQQFTDDFSCNKNLQLGIKYYLQHFFEENGRPKYYSNKVFPVDLNCTAQLAVTVWQLGNMPKYDHLVKKVLSWSVTHMWNTDGYFSYQRSSFLRNSIPYMRWTQAWMFYALTCYLRHNHIQ